MAELQRRAWHLRLAPPHLVQRSKSMSPEYMVMSVLNLITSAWEAFADWRRRERAYDELMALDDHSLADIGIRRSDIRAICEGSHAPASVPSAKRREFISPETHLIWPWAKP
jgi:uncharacterized protein YjiS (DUF1127 family)